MFNSRLLIQCLFVALSMLHYFDAIAQRDLNNYWQQHVDYKISIQMDVETHQYKGVQTVIYTNNSPDTLRKIYFHLYPNAFQPNSDMDIRSKSLPDPDPRVGDRISKLTPEEIGYLHLKVLRQNNNPLRFKEEGTILWASLSEALLPHSKATFYLEFEAQVPLQIRRSGRDNKEGIDYSMTQWYPKICEYDLMGWHPNPYIGREFYGVWGDYEVKITIDQTYILGGTGVLQNGDEIGYNYQSSNSSKKYRIRKRHRENTWHFVAKNVHDFAFAADPDYYHNTYKIPNGPTLHFLYQENENTKHWEKLPTQMGSAFAFMNQNIGKYPYSQYTFIQGGDGGMEYPNCTLLTGNRNEGSLIGVAIHEMVHSWFQGMLANNEARFAWMDEGFTSYYSAQVSEALEGNYKINAQVGYKGYSALVNSGREEPATTHADHFITNFGYSQMAYSKGAVFLSQLRNIIGESAFNNGMKRYFNEWKFKHPEGQDFIRVMEKESGLILDWYYDYMINTTHYIDFGVVDIESVGKNETLIKLEKRSQFPMPIHIDISLISGEHLKFYIPIDLMRGHKPLGRKVKAKPAWRWVNNQYSFTIPYDKSIIEDVTIDPNNFISDIDRSNNSKK